MAGSRQAAGDEARQTGGSGTYRAGAAVALASSLLTIWTTVVRDDGNGIGFFMLVMAMAVGAFSASFRAAGMSRTMVGVAIMQLALGMLIATAPSTANLRGGSARALLFSGGFALLWLISAAFFRAASRSGRTELAA
jgi:hypothetical protein